MNKKTKWKNSQKDGAPFHKQKVLISVEGVNYTAVYDSVEERFELQIDPVKFLSLKKEVIYWMELTLE